VVKTLHMWLHKNAHRVRDGYLYVTSGYRAKIIGMGERCEGGVWREAKLVYRGGDMYLYIAVEIPRPTPIAPKGVIAVDVNERYVYYGNSQWMKKVETPVEKAVRLMALAERLAERRSTTHHPPWRKGKELQARIRHYYKKARDVVEDWARKTAKRTVEEAREGQCAVAVEDLTGLVEAIRASPKEHRVRMITLAYRRLLWWVKWQAAKRGVVVVEVDTRGTSTTCPKCGSEMEKVGHRRVKCVKCGFETGRDIVAIYNIEKRARERLSNPTFSPLAILTPS